MDVTEAVPNLFLDEEPDVSTQDQVVASIHTTATITVPPRAVSEIEIPVSRSVV
jgi:hypothetical protein